MQTCLEEKTPGDSQTVTTNENKQADSTTETTNENFHAWKPHHRQDADMFEGLLVLQRTMLILRPSNHGYEKDNVV